MAHIMGLGNQSESWKITILSEKFTKYIYTKIIVWCEDEKRSIPLQVERKVIVNTQGKDQLLLLRVSRWLAIFRQLTYQIYYKRI